MLVSWLSSLKVNWAAVSSGQLLTILMLPNSCLEFAPVLRGLTAAASHQDMAS